MRKCQYLWCHVSLPERMERCRPLGARNVRLIRLPLPKVVRALKVHDGLDEALFVGLHAVKGLAGLASLGGRARAVVEGDFEQGKLHADHDDGLDK